MMEEQSRRHGAVTVGWSGQRGRRAMSKLGITLVVVTGACTQPEGQVAREGRALSVSQEGPASPPGPVAQEKLVALVVGNGDYEDTRVLKDLSNPANDARDIAEVLERLDFRVTTKVNASYAEFREALRQFAKDSEKADIGLLFYAGHGVEMEGVNYLLPVDAELSSYTDLRRDGLQLRRDVLGSMPGDGLRLVILDACRNQPELRRRMMRGTGTRALSVSNGSFGALPDIDKSEEEILVAYAAAAGEEAYDGEGQRNSPYTAALLQQLEQRKPLEQVFKAVRRQVVEETRDWAKGPQKPYEYGSLVHDYYLAGRPKDLGSEVNVRPLAGVEAERMALVVGNSDYEHLERLANAGNDATDVAEALRRLDFRVATLLDASHAELDEALQVLQQALEQAAESRSESAPTVLVFYAGYGMGVGGVNYLLPVDAKVDWRGQLQSKALTLDHVLASTSGAGLRVVIVDSCGFDPVKVALTYLGDETLVAYSTEPGKSSSDGEGQRNSPYTAALLAQLEQAHELTEVFRAVRNQVLEETEGAQSPIDYSSLQQEHYLAGRPSE